MTDSIVFSAAALVAFVILVWALRKDPPSGGSGSGKPIDPSDIPNQN